MPPEALYLLKVIVTLIVFLLSAGLFLRYMKIKGHVHKSDEVKIITSLRLSSRDLFFVIKCGPDVLAITLSGNNGARLMGRWSYEEWNKSKSDKENNK